MSNAKPAARALRDYPLSLQIAAQALWGDDFWGRYKPRPVTPQPPRAKAGGRSHKPG